MTNLFASDTGAQPDTLSVEQSAHTDELRLVFERDDGSSARVILTIEQATVLLAELSDKIAPGSLAPTSLSAIRPGASIQVSNHSVSRKPDGGAVLKLGASLENRFVWVPLELSSAAVRELVESLR